MSEILLVEDDPALGRGLSIYLEIEGHSVHWVRSLKAAFEENEKLQLNLVILDLGLPDGTGLHFLKHLRETGSRLPVIILTAQTDEDSVVEGLQNGASDYVRKPFGHKELLARIKTVLREPTKREDQIRYEGLILLLEKRQAMFDSKSIELNRREFDILSYFVQNADAIVTRDVLLKHIDKDSEIFDRTVDSHVSHLRTKLKKSGVTTVQIISVYGVGYRLEKK